MKFLDDFPLTMNLAVSNPVFDRIRHDPDIRPGLSHGGPNVKVVIDPTLPPNVAEWRDTNGRTVQRITITDM